MGTEAKACKNEYRADYPRLFFIPEKIERSRHRIEKEGESKEARLARKICRDWSDCRGNLS